MVACPLGFLFNKDKAMEHLLAKTMPAGFAHIKSVKDLLPCTFSSSSSVGVVVVVVVVVFVFCFLFLF